MSKNGNIMFKIGNIIGKALLCFAAFIVVVSAIGFFWLIYDYNRCQRVPVYQTVMTDFEVVQWEDEQWEEGKDNLRWWVSTQQRGLRKIIEAFEIKTFQCVIFQSHNLRPHYRIYMVGDIPENTDFSEYRQEKYSLKNDKRLFHTLKLCGADPLESEYCMTLKDDFKAFACTYRNRIILSVSCFSHTFLMNDAEKQACLEQFIAPRKK